MLNKTSEKTVVARTRENVLQHVTHGLTESNNMILPLLFLFRARRLESSESMKNYGTLCKTRRLMHTKHHT